MLHIIFFLLFLSLPTISCIYVDYDICVPYLYNNEGKVCQQSISLIFAKVLSALALKLVELKIGFEPQKCTPNPLL